nr:MAG: ORF1 [Torque teno midi virus]
MPFWWNRRRKPWYGKWRWRRSRKPRYKKRRYGRRRSRYPTRRRRRRRRRKYKVRKKNKQITIKQWNPDSIKKCKIIGLQTLVAGSQGNQYRCYTNQRKEYTVPKAPGGGGLGVSLYTLNFLYSEWRARNNIWTTSNDYTDLCRYTGCKFKIFRHDFTDFVVSYNIMPPFHFTKDTYLDTHPHNQILTKKHRMVFSRKTKPNSKPYITLKIKPPKLLRTHWYFQEEFAEQPLVQLSAAAADFSYGIYGWNTQSTNVTIFALNDKFYTTHNWAQNTGESPYKPYPGYPSSGLTFTNKNGTDKTVPLSNYAQSVAQSTGIFQPAVLQAIDVKFGQQRYHERTVGIGRYNPEIDTGEGNKVWLTSVLSDRGWGPPTDDKLIIYNKPLWQAFYGLWDWINIAKPKTQAFETSMFVVQSQFISRLTATEQKVWPIIDPSFVQGKLPYGEDITKQDQALWYPTAMVQRETISAIVQSGSYIPKYAQIPQSTWQLQTKYTFYFKWGGPQVTEKNVQDPKEQSTYPIPNSIWETIKITNPEKQHCKQLLRSWDFRRGIATTRAIKRMSENLETDTSFSSDDSETPKKKKRTTSEMPLQDKKQEKIQSCLLSLFEEDSCPEQTEDIQQLITKQHQQQQKLKRNLIQLLMNLKKKQRHLLMQTGLE